MDQPTVENVEQVPNNDIDDCIEVEQSEDVLPTKELKPFMTEEMETGSEVILIDPLKIETAVTEITTEIVPIVISNDGAIPDCLSKDQDNNSQPSFEVSEQLLETVCIDQSESSDIKTEATEQNEALNDSANDENIVLDEVKLDEVPHSEDPSLSRDTGESTNQPEENVEYVEENILAEETCDPSAMSVVEEIVTTSKSTYSVEIQEQDSMDDRVPLSSKSAYSVEIQEQDSIDGKGTFITKDLVMLEVVSENEETIHVVEENIEEVEIDETQDCDDGTETLPSEILISQTDVEDNTQSLEEMTAKEESRELVDNDKKSIITLENAIEMKTNQDEAASQKVSETNLVKTTESHRSVIQEIVDDWIDDNIDDICEAQNNASNSHDAVEIELKTLLADDKPSVKDIKITKYGNKCTNKSPNEGKIGAILRKSRNNTEFVIKERVNGLENRPKTSKSITTRNEPKSISNYTPTKSLVRSVTKVTQGTTASKGKPRASSPGSKITARHLMSQIASKAEVTEVLKERIKQKQKEIELPQGGDILFVKKITQRLSSKLSGASTHDFARKKIMSHASNISSENYSNNSAEDKVRDEAEKLETADNRELLAILEGDVDPDWSNLKPQTVHEASKSSSESTLEPILTGKLDPLTERELALKQLLELPSISAKKNALKKKRTFKPAPSRASSNCDQTASSHGSKQTVSAMDPEQEYPDPDDSLPIIDVAIKPDEMDIEQGDDRVEESRSGRKRKPTEKAREHEQNSTKKQKVYKGKVMEHKKSYKTEDPFDKHPQEPPELDHHPKEEESMVVDHKSIGRNILSKVGPTKNRIYQTKSSKMRGKLAQNVVKRNMTGKKLMRQKTSGNITNAKNVHMKSKFTSPQNKYRSKMKQKVQKHLLEVPSSEIKPKKKFNEIDKLLQDEGVVNLLYDVEQPERKRLIPITKSQTKVVDLHKVQRELKIRTKLVRNAVLRLRTTGGSSPKISSRSKRTGSHISSPEYENRENERIKSTRSSISSEFIFPAKIRNAADASIIVRRHSSSSFSSTSGSPRASIDGPEKQMEASGSEEVPAHVTRSVRRRHSQNEKNKQITEVLSMPKKNGVNRKKLNESAETESVVTAEKSTVGARPNLRAEDKIGETKTNKTTENIDVGESSSNGFGNKVTTRSNGTSGEKEITKTKKVMKTKASGSRTRDVIEIETETVEEDKLSACLAEAASALSNVEGTANQSGCTSVIRKLRTPSVASKEIEKSPLDMLDQFDSTEINLQRHGNIVQIILTPSTTKLKNGLTLQIMHEIREALLLLRRDETCRVVLLTSTGTSFCEGLDLSNLINENKEERRVYAEEMANSVKEFIKTLANFNKPIVAGIQGAAIGLSVTMLPLFDLVIASDKATFSTPYGQLGQIPEGAAILTLSHTIGNTVTSELLLGGRTLTASEALRAGLVTRVLWPDRFQGELIPSLRAMSEHSSQSMEATKTLLRHNLRKKLDAALESESYLLIQHWCSAECQTLIKSYLDGKSH